MGRGSHNILRRGEAASAEKALTFTFKSSSLGSQMPLQYSMHSLVNDDDLSDFGMMRQEYVPNGGGVYQPSQFYSSESSRDGSPSSIFDDDDDCINSSDLSGDSFIAVLHAIVSDESLDNAIHWLPCGKKFIVANREEFVRSVLSQNNFGSRRGGTSSTKYTSFTRRLKRWNFTRTASGRDIGAYHHEFFIKGEPELAEKIVLLKKEPTKGTSSSAPHTPGMKGNKKRKPRRATTGSLLPFPDNKTTAQDMKGWLSGTRLWMTSSRSWICPQPPKNPRAGQTSSINP